MSRASATAAEIVCGRIRHAGAASSHPSNDVRFESVVDDPDQWPAFVVATDVHDRARRHLAHEVLVLPAGDCPRPIDGRVAVDEARLRDDAAKRTVGSEVAGEGPRVDPGDRRDAGAPEERGELANVVEDGGRGVRDDECPKPRPEGLVVVDDPAVVADQRVGHDDRLAGV